MKLILKKLILLGKDCIIFNYSKLLYLYTKDIFSLHILILFLTHFIFNYNIFI